MQFGWNLTLRFRLSLPVLPAVPSWMEIITSMYKLNYKGIHMVPNQILIAVHWPSLLHITLTLFYVVFFLVLCHNFFVFHQILNVKKRKFAENSLLSHAYDQKVLAPLIWQLEQFKYEKKWFQMNFFMFYAITPQFFIGF